MESPAAPDPAARRAIQQAAALGDRARRSCAARSWVAGFLPWAAAVACAASAVTLLAGRLRPLSLVLLAASAAVSAVMLIAARLARPVSDDTVAELDTIASLDGALRSAHWFARQHRAGAGSSADEAWIKFHIEAAAARVARVDWPALFVRPLAPRRWTATAALSAAALALMAVDAPRLSSHAEIVADAGGDTLIVVPPHLAGDVVEGMNAIKAGRPPTKQALTAVGQAIEIAKKDPRARRELDDLFAQSGSADGRFLDAGQGDHDWDVNEMPYWDDGTPRLEWAYEAAVARAAVEESGAPADAAEPSRREAGEGRPGAIDRGVRGTMKPDGPPLLAATRGQPGSFSSLLFGRQAATDETAATSPRATGAPNAALVAALRREVVHARTDGGVTNTAGSPRRPPEPSRGRTAGPGVTATGLHHDASRAGRPPAVPDARRVLLHDFFVRPAEPPPAAVLP